MQINFSQITFLDISNEPIEIAIAGDSQNYIIFVPGGTVNLRDLEDIMIPLSQKYKIVMFNYPNTEIFRNDREILLQDYFKVIDHLIDNHGTPIAMIGQSLGGGVALSYAGKNNNIKKVIGIAPLLAPIQRSRFSLWILVFRNIWQRSVQEKSTKPLNDLKKNAINIKRNLKIFNAVNHFNFQQYISNLKSQTLFFVGGKDLITNPAEQIKIANTLPNAQVVEYKDLGHSLLHVQTQDVVNHIFKFLED